MSDQNPKRMTEAEKQQELYDIRAAFSLLKVEVATKLSLSEKQASHFYKLMKFAEWFATGWEYFQKAAVWIGIIGGFVGLVWGKSWFVK